jgi:hypothetical protein
MSRRYPVDLKERIKDLNGDASRLLLVLLTCDGSERLQDLPDLIARAGLGFDESNKHGKNRYARAFQQLLDLGFIALDCGSIIVLFETGIMRGEVR